MVAELVKGDLLSSPDQLTPLENYEAWEAWEDGIGHGQYWDHRIMRIGSSNTNL
jgi:hypothetical protein